MNRRGFIGLLGAAAVVPLVPVPELDLDRRIFLPPRGGWLVTPTLTMDELRRKYLRPAMIELARRIEHAALDIQVGDRITIAGLDRPLIVTGTFTPKTV